MVALGRSARLLSRLERAVDRAVAGRERCALAFSGGLGSLVVGSVARKRTDLDCIVVDVRSGADRAAAELASQFLDFRVRVLGLSPRDALTLARRRMAADPGRSLTAALAPVPLEAVMEAEPRVPLLAGSWRPPHGRGPRLRPSPLRLRLPILDMAATPPVSRADLLGVGRLLGIPESLLRNPSRSPAVGSGLRRALEAIARRRGTSVARILRP